MSKKTAAVLAAAVVITCAGLIAYNKHKQTYGFGQYYKGTVTYINCDTAGVGCVEYSLVEDSKGRLGLSGVSKEVLHQYIGKKVKVKGVLGSYVSPPGGKYLQVESIQVE